MSQVHHIDLHKLQPQQLVDIRRQVDQEVQHFTQSLQALQTAQAKLKDCIGSIENLERVQDGKQNGEILVPLTSSLYLPGNIVKNNEYLVDIGTGYFVEKNAKDAQAVYETKIQKLTEDGQKLKEILVGKNDQLNKVNLVLREKMVEYEKQQGQEA